MGHRKNNSNKKLALIHSLTKDSDVEYYGLDHFYYFRPREGNLLTGINFQNIDFNENKTELVIESYSGRNLILGYQEKRTIIKIVDRKLSVKRWLNGNLRLDNDYFCD
jgi:hypothetical protein